VKMLRTRKLGNFPRIAETKAAANRNGNTVRRAFHEARDHSIARDYVGSASRGENAMATSGNHIFQCLFQMGCRIKGAVKGDFKRTGQLDERASAFNIDGAAVEKYAENHTGSANTPNVLDFVAHGSEGRDIVMKVPGTGTHHHVNRNFAVAHSLLDERVRRCEAIHLKCSAKFDTIRAAFLPSEACFQSFGTQFEYHRMAQDSCFSLQRPECSSQTQGAVNANCNVN